MKTHAKFLTLIASLLCFTFISIKSYAASNYSIATQFTFSSDMNIEEGFTLIQPYILYENDTISTKKYSFKATLEEGNRYHYTGTYPNGTTFSIHGSIQILEHSSGTYVEALKREPYRQSIYVKALKEGSTINDCLLECFQNRYVSIKDPTYNITNANSTNIYNHLTSFTISTGEVKQLQYFAIKEGEQTTKPNPPNEEPENPDLPPLPDDSNDEEKEDPPKEPLTPSEPSPNEPNKDPSSSKPSIQKEQTDPILILLICVGALIGFFFLYLLYKTIKGFSSWLKK